MVTQPTPQLLSAPAAAATAKLRVLRVLEESEHKVLLRSDFQGLAGTSQLSKVLRMLIEEGAILRVSQGAYVRARPSCITGKPVPNIPMTELVLALFTRLDVEVFPCRATLEYNAGRTTQLPGRMRVSTGKRRITREVRAGAQVLEYEAQPRAATADGQRNARTR